MNLNICYIIRSTQTKNLDKRQVKYPASKMLAKYLSICVNLNISQRLAIFLRGKRLLKY